MLLFLVLFLLLANGRLGDHRRIGNNLLLDGVGSQVFLDGVGSQVVVIVVDGQDVVVNQVIIVLVRQRIEVILLELFGFFQFIDFLRHIGPSMVSWPEA